MTLTAKTPHFLPRTQPLLAQRIRSTVGTGTEMDRPTLDFRNAGLTDAGLDYLSYYLSDPSKATRLDLSENQLTDGCVDDLVTLLKRFPHIKDLDLGVNSLTGNGLFRLADGIGRIPSLRRLTISTNPLGASGGMALAKLLANNPDFTALEAGNCQLGDVGFEDFSKILGAHHRLTKLVLKGNSITLPGARRFSEALRHDRSLVFVDLTHATSKEIDRHFEEAFKTWHSPNITDVSPTSSALQMRSRNKKRDLGNYSIYVNEPFENQALSVLAGVEERRNSLHYHHSDTKGLREFDRFMDNMPLLPPGGSGFEEDLFTPMTSKRFAPLDNPRLYRQQDELFERLDHFCDLSQDLLARKTPAGTSLLSAMSRMSQPATLVTYLNERDIQLGPAQLLDASGQPNEVMRDMTARGGTPAILSPANTFGFSWSDTEKLRKAAGIRERPGPGR